MSDSRDSRGESDGSNTDATQEGSEQEEDSPQRDTERTRDKRKEEESRRRKEKQKRIQDRLLKDPPVVVESQRSKGKGKSSKSSRKRRNRERSRSPTPLEIHSSASEDRDCREDRRARKHRKSGKKRQRHCSSSDDSDSSQNSNKWGKSLSKLAKVMGARDRELVKALQKVGKRSESSESSDQDDEGKVTMWDEMYHIYDNGADVIDINLRHKLSNPNSDPTVWWPRSKRTGDIKIIEPQRGGSLYLTHLMGEKRINSRSIKSFHNRTGAVSVKTLLTKNAHISAEDRVGTLKRDNKLKLSKDWKEASNVHEVMGALINHISLSHQVRPYSYESIALLQAIHETRAFFGVTDSPKKQKELLEKALDSVWQANRSRAQAYKEPMQYTEVMEHLRRVVLDNQHLTIPGAVQLGLQAGDCYSGTKSESASNIQKLNDKIKQLESRDSKRFSNQEPRRQSQGKPGPDKSRERDNRRDRKTRRTLEDKIKETCEYFNSRKGCSDRSCRKHHRCSNRVTINGPKGDYEGLCWGSHTKPSCPK